MSDPAVPTEARARFETAGPSWSARATSGELAAVLDPWGSEHRNRFLHGVEAYAARRALRKVPRGGTVVDFGCGTGRFVRYFGGKGHKVVGLEITPEMLDEARRFGLPPGAEVHVTDGVHVPLPDASVDLVWVCGVLKYSLFEPGGAARGGDAPSRVAKYPEELAPGETPGFVAVYRDIAREMYRVLKPGRFVVNLEMFVDTPPDPFLPGFEGAGFATRDVRVLHREGGRPEAVGRSARWPLFLTAPLGRLCATYRYYRDDPRAPKPGLRDYLFVWQKPAA